jgi:hypothetical protein
MPKKSKKEKIIAEQKRKLFTRTILPSPVDGYSAVQQPTVFQFQLKNKTHTSTGDTVYRDKTELITIKHDLTKTVTLALIALGIEVALYWFSRGKF